MISPDEALCQACGACCAYSAEWPRFALESEAALAAIPRIYVDEACGRMRCGGNRCSALTGELGVAMVHGLQGDDPRYLKTAACAKHYAVHSGPERLRHTLDARPNPRRLTFECKMLPTCRRHEFRNDFGRKLTRAFYSRLVSAHVKLLTQLSSVSELTQYGPQRSSHFPCSRQCGWR